MVSSSSASLVAILSAIEPSSFTTDTDRAQVLDSLLAALRRIQRPWDIAFEQGWVQPAVLTAIKTLHDAGLWSKWVASTGRSATISDLSRLSGVDGVLLERLLRCIAGEKLLHQESEDTYALTPFATALGDGKFASIYDYIYHTNLPIFQNFPKFAGETAYKNPQDVAHGNFQSLNGDGSDLFGFYAANPAAGADFGNAMNINANSKTPWPRIYPSSNIINGAKPDRALVVDVGGSVGHDLQAFFAANPHAPNGSLVLQNVPTVIENTKLESPFIPQAHDFFQPQPVKGARAYYMHCVLHDWPDQEAVKILQNLASAMEKGYSRILIHETVVQAIGTHRYGIVSDLTMMFVASAAERTEAMWRDLATKAGLVVTKIWTTPEAIESIIELELP